MPKRLNELVVKELTSKYDDIDSCLVVDYRGITSEEANKLRRTLKQNNISMEVVKNSLASLAFKNLHLEEINSLLDGPSAIIKGDDPVVLAKSVSNWIKENDTLNLRGGYVEGKLLTAEEIQKITRIPSREELYARILGGINSPLVGMAMAFNGVLQKLVLILKAVENQKSQDGEVESSTAASDSES